MAAGESEKAPDRQFQGVREVAHALHPERPAVAVAAAFP